MRLPIGNVDWILWELIVWMQSFRKGYEMQPRCYRFDLKVGCNR